MQDTLTPPCKKHWKVRKTNPFEKDARNISFCYVVVGSMPEKKIDLKVRVYKCSSCGLVLKRSQCCTRDFEEGFGTNPYREAASA